MRDRIEELEGEVTGLRDELRRLEAEMESTRRRNDATVERYERLLERRTTTDTEDAPEEADDGGILAWVRRILTR
jgi:molecular chaperone GrpE (heat shock protein)